MNKKLTGLLIGTMTAAVLTGCGMISGGETMMAATTMKIDETLVTTTEVPETEPVRDDAAIAEEVLSQMTLEEKVAQLFMITPEDLAQVEDGYATEAGEATQEALSTYTPGGIIYFADNLLTTEQVQRLISATQGYSKYGLLIGVDEEGGEVSRLGANPEIAVNEYPSMSEIGAAGDVTEAYTLGASLGSEMSALGFNMNFAPVADVVPEDGDSVIGSRSFGSDASLVGEMVASEVNGLQENNVSAVLKHFPGHGSTSEDSHEGSVVTDRSLEEFQAVDFVPFEAGINAGADAVMVAHITATALDDTQPASLSSVVITDILRNQLGFQGVVVTDALRMNAISDYHTSAEASIMALQAGADLLLMPYNFRDAYDGVLAAVTDGTLTEARINESVLRILELKSKRGLIE